MQPSHECYATEGSTELLRLIKPGAPEQSMLWRKIVAFMIRREGSERLSCGTYAMPPFVGLLSISPASTEIIERWIREGALDN